VIRIGGNHIPDTFIWQTRTGVDRVATRCKTCEGVGYAENNRRDFETRKGACGSCHGGGWHGIDPSEPTDCRPVEELDGCIAQPRVAVYQVRYALGFPIWHADDTSVRPTVKPNPERTYPRSHSNHWNEE